jgi:hypothetical protein
MRRLLIVVVGLLAGTALAACAGPDRSSPAGSWRDQVGTVYQFTASGSAYDGEVTHNTGNVCTPVAIKLTGTSRHYHGPERFYSGLRCGKFTGNGTIFFVVGADGKTAAVTWAAPGSVSCGNCAPTTFTRVADPPGGFPWWIVVVILIALLLAVGYIAWRRRSRRTDPPGSPLPPAPAVPAAPV